MNAELPPGLRWSSDRVPGITRQRRHGSFVYFKPDGSRITEERELARIRKLAVPPAYENVWICPHPGGHVQATGRDARGRKQYRYHPRWREVRDETKFHRLTAFARTLPRIRKRVAADLARDGLPREKVLAAVVRLLDMTGMRVGNEEYARANGSYGITTLRAAHVRVHGNGVRFRFRGKSGKEHTIALDDARLARIIRRCRDLPGEGFSAKDFRTWIGTVACMTALSEAAENAHDAKGKVVAALQCVAAKLGNTPAVCRKSYVHPAVIEAYLRDLRVPASRDERAVRRFLELAERMADVA